jgi:hypothetical protein
MTVGGRCAVRVVPAVDARRERGESDRSQRNTGALCQLLESVVGGLYPVYPHDGDQVPFDLIQHSVRANAQPTVGTADEPP